MLIKIPDRSFILDTDNIESIYIDSEFRSHEPLKYVVSIDTKDDIKSKYTFACSNKEEAEELINRIYDELNKDKKEVINALTGSVNPDFVEMFLKPRYEVCNCEISQESIKEHFDEVWSQYADDIYKQEIEKLKKQVEELQKQIDGAE